MTIRSAMEEAERLLSSEDVEIRKRAVENLRGSPPEFAVPFLLRAMRDKSWRVRKTASELLRSYPPEHYAGNLIGLLSLGEDAGARNEAIETLVGLGRQATPLLMEAFETPDRDVRKFLIDIIGTIRDKRALPLLLKALKDEDENVKASAVEYLGQSGGPEVVDALVKILEGGDVWTAYPAADALGRIGDRRAVEPLIRALSIKALREPILASLGRFSIPETLSHVAPFMMDKSRTIQEAALKTIETFYHKGTPAEYICNTLTEVCGQDVVRRIIPHAWSQKPEIRSAAILILGLLQREEAIAPLLDLYLDENLSDDVKRALIFIGKRRPESLLPLFEGGDQYQKRFLTEVASQVASPLYYTLFERLLSGNDGHIRAYAAIGISRIGDMRAISLLKRLLSDPYRDVQEAIVEALGNLREGLEAEEFIGLLRNPDPNVRRNAALVLCKIDGSQLVPALGFALKDEDVSVRQAVVRVLSSVKTEESVRQLINALTDEDPDIRISAILSLGDMEASAAIDQLILMLKDPDDGVRAAAARSLGTIGDSRATGDLIDLLTDRNGFVVASAIGALGKISDVLAREAITGMLRSGDRELKRTAIFSLSSFKGIEDVLLPYLNDPDWATRAAAIEVLCRRPSEGVKKEIERLYDREEDDIVRKTIEECLHDR
jgi:HEAT repeat protein